ncbi:MAG: ABC transporter permease [Spirochaetota bacterium]
MYIALFLFLAVSGIIMPRSVGKSSMQTVILEASLLGIVALGQGVVMLSGGLDISVGNTMFFVIVYGGNLMATHPDWLIPIVLFCLAVGGLVGAINGIGVAKIKISPIIMTLATSSMLFGSVYIFGGGRLGGAVPGSLQAIGKKIVGEFFPLTGFIWLGLAAVSAFILHRTTYGRKIYATGNNPRAAWLSGVNSDGVLIQSYIVCGFLSALAGILLLGYLGTPTLRFTDIYTMGSIAASVLGGVEFFQGVGSIIGTVAGAFWVRFIFTLLIMLNVSEAGRMIAEGLLIIIIVGAYKLRER